MTATVTPGAPVVTATVTQSPQPATVTPQPAQQVVTATVTPGPPAAVATPEPVPLTATPTPQPTPTPRPTPAPWFGPAVNRAFFAEGYTGAGYHEYLSLLNPRRRVMRAELTIYRADGATRGLGLRLAPLSRRTLD